MSRPGARILIVDDDPVVGESLSEFLRLEGYRPQVASDIPAAMSTLSAAGRDESEGPFSLVIADVSLPGGSGLDLLTRIGREMPAVAVLMLTAYGTVESAVRALRLGAVDYLTKPVVDSELRMALERALRHQALLAENQSLRNRLATDYGLRGVVGADPRMKRIFELVQAAAGGRTTVLMTGESGTGKSLVARAIHDAGPRRGKPFVEVSCGSIPETLLESELFGHVKGAFTGAHADKTGRFLAADGGTIFLDEINSASPAMQLKLLRILQERKFEPVGSSRTLDADVRIILASNQPLEALVAEGRFRQDLYYRINVLTIELPPLRQRRDDIADLAAHFLRMHAAELGRQITGFSPEAAAALQRYAFPGNVRELQNIIERAAVLSRSPTIGIDDLPDHLRGGDAAPSALRITASPQAPGRWEPTTLEEALRGPERSILLQALAANGWNRQKTAEQLGINRTTLYKKMKLHGIDGREQAA